MQMRFFYTTHYPHRWSSGPSIYYTDSGDEHYSNIKTLERARELAREHAVESYGDDRCVTTYGVTFEEDWTTAPEIPPTPEEEQEKPSSEEEVKEKLIPLCSHYRHTKIDIETQAGMGFEWFYRCNECDLTWGCHDDFPLPSAYPPYKPKS